MNRLIGLTGGIASGKSTVTRMLKELGAFIIDADQIARNLVKPGLPAYKEIRKAFGKKILSKTSDNDTTPPIDRKALREAVFGKSAQLAKLDKILADRIVAEALSTYKELSKRNPYRLYFYDAATIFEAGADRKLFKIVVVYIPEELQLQRLMERDDCTLRQAKSAIKSQIPIDEKRKHADYVIYNDRNLETTRKQVSRVFNELSTLCNKSL